MKLKKLVSALVSGAMILGTLAAVPAFAASDTLPEAVDGVITLTEDVKLGSDFDYNANGGSLTIDLAGHSLKLTGNTILKNGVYTIKNGTVDVENVECTSREGLIRIAPHSDDSATLNMDNVTVKANGYNAQCGLFQFETPGKLNLNKVTINAANVTDGYGVFYSSPGNPSSLTMNKVTMTVTGANKLIYGCNAVITDSNISAQVKKDVFSAVSPVITDSTLTVGAGRAVFNDANVYITTATVINSTITPTGTLTSGIVNNTNASSKIILDSVSDIGTTKGVCTASASIGSNLYSSFADALDAAQDGDTITLLADAVTEASYQPAEEKGINIDLGGNKLTFNYGANYFKGSNTISNGTVDISNIENLQCIFGLGMYDTTQDTVLTFNNVNLIGNNVKSGYAVFQIGNNGKNDKLIFNGGSVDIALRADDSYGGFVKGGTSSASVEFNNTDITLKDTHMTFVNTNVTLNNGTEMTVSGENVDYVFNSGNPNGKTVNINSGSSLKADNVDVTKSRGLDFNLNNGNLTATGDTYINDSSNFDLTNNSTLIAECNVNVAKITTDETSTASVKTADSVKATFVNTDNPNVYDIYIYGGSNGSQTINRFTAADFTFNLDVTEGAINYEISSNTDAKIELTPKNNNRYMFHMDGVNVDTLSGGKIKIGQVTFTGYGKFSFGIADVDTNEVHATKAVDSIVNTYIVGGNTANNEGELIIDNTLLANKELAVPTKTLTINIKFPNAVSDNANAYQSMNVTIAGGTTNETIKLGSGAGETAMENGAYKIEKDLPENTPYTVTVSGAGYRTARYTVNLNADKTLNFWNNVKDAEENIETGVGTPSKTNFLAGDIVKDNNINIYDLSAVVSYFGTDNLVTAHPEYARYDLNRDGKIDSKDVAYVLVSWNN